MALVFLYGANMSSIRLNGPDQMAGLAAPMGLALTVEEFELDFTCMSRRHACGIADLTPFPESPLRGVFRGDPFPESHKTLTGECFGGTPILRKPALSVSETPSQKTVSEAISHRGRKIYGVLYDIPDDRVFRNSQVDWQLLDDIEDEGGTHQRREIQVVLIGVPSGYEDKPISALSYCAKKPEPFLKTELHYVIHLLEGLREFSAPPEYIDYVKFRIIRTTPKLALALDKF